MSIHIATLGREIVEEQAIEIIGTPAWHQQAGESRRAYALFTTFREAGPHRSYAALAREQGVTRQAISGMARRHNWDRRIAAFDKWVEGLKASALQRAMEDVAERHIRLLDGLGEKIAKRLEAMRPEEISAGLLPTYIQTLISHERQAHELVKPEKPPEPNTNISNFSGVILTMPYNYRGDSPPPGIYMSKDGGHITHVIDEDGNPPLPKDLRAVIMLGPETGPKHLPSPAQESEDDTNNEEE